MISPCGINCETCPAYLVSLSGNINEKKKLAKEWSSLECSFEPEEIHCTGCLESEWKMTEVCKTRKCIKSKNFSSCAECGTYPCSKCGQNENLDMLKSTDNSELN